MKFFGKESLPNAIASGLLMFLTYAVLVQVGVVLTPGSEAAPEMFEITSELSDAPRYRVVDEPGESQLR